MGKAPGTEVEESILCKNPQCPSRKGGRYKAGRSWSLHIAKSESCRGYYLRLQEDENSGGGASGLGEPESTEIGAGPSLTEGGWDEENEEEEDIDPREWRTEWIQGAGVRSATQGGTYWEQRRQHENPLNPCAPWRDTAELELAEWLISAGLPETKIDEFLNLKYVTKRPPSFRSGAALFSMITHSDMPSGPAWHRQTITLDEAPDEPQELYYQYPDECANFLFGNPTFRGDMHFTPGKVFEGQGEFNRVFHEMWTGDAWIRAQNSAPPGATVCPIILASDKAALTTHSGSKASHNLLISIGNIKNSVRASVERRAYLLLAYIPCNTKWEVTVAKYDTKTQRAKMPGYLSKILFHKCMDTILSRIKVPSPRMIVDCDGYFRFVISPLMAYLADMEEQWLVMAIARSQCPHGTAGTHDWSSCLATECQRRKSEEIFEAIQKVRRERPSASTWQFMSDCGDAGLGGVREPFWRDMKNVDGSPLDMVTVLSPDLLHSVVSMWMDHPAKWTINSIGEHEVDIRVRSDPHQSGERSFFKGISSLTQWTGRQTRDLQKKWVAMISGAIHDKTGNTMPTLVEENRALMDYVYMAHYPAHTTQTLAEMDDSVCLYAEQMLRVLDRQERMDLMCVYMDWRQPGWRKNEVDNESSQEEDGITPKEQIAVKRRKSRFRTVDLTNAPHLKLNKTPHRISVPITDIQAEYQLPDLVQDLGVFLKTFNPSLTSLPTEFLLVDVWNDMRVEVPVINEYYPEEWRRIRAHPSPSIGGVQRYDPVLIHETDEAEVVGLQGFRVGELRLIFRPAGLLPMHLDQPTPYPEYFGYVFDFTDIKPRPEPHTRLHQVSKLYKNDRLGGQRRGSAIDLTDITRPCPLFPAVQGRANPDITPTSSLEYYDVFFINSFASHNDFRCLYWR
ncbi:hypothetical protein FRC05_003509 [Tulasnella sp. 425]|nr:hypothetical protein FRC05_003509 [Tulasnella sp. 425]